jgi:tetratricopeptide (TPR) repeat protein
MAQMRVHVPSFTDEELLGLTSIETLFLRAQDPGNRDKLLQQPLVASYLRKAWDHLQLARDGCPVMGKVHLMLARLWPLFGEPGGLDGALTSALYTSPGDPDNLYDIGLLKLYSGQSDEAIELWRKSLAGNKAFRDQMIQIGTRTLGPVEFYRRLLVGMPDDIIEIANNEYRGPGNITLRMELAALAEQQLRDVDGAAEMRDDLLGAVYRLREEWALAAECYEKALKRSPENLDWRLALVRTYIQLKKYPQAKLHAQFGQRLAGPSSRSFSALLQQIQRESDRQKR